MCTLYALLLFSPVTETVFLTDELKIDAQYMPKGSILEDEGMVLSIVDFSVVQTELELDGTSCERRISNIRDLSKKELKRSQARSTSSLNRLSLEVKLLKSLNRSQKDDLERANSSLFGYRLSLILGMTAVTVLAAVIIIY